MYLNDGIHRLLNFSTQHGEERGLVLIRALKPISGIAIMESRRGTKKIEALCSGPGKLCQALGVRLDTNGARLGDSRFQLWKEDDALSHSVIDEDRRIGITKSVDLAW